MLGASGAVGGQVLQTLFGQQNVARISLLGRTPIPDLRAEGIVIEQHRIDIHHPDTYRELLPGHTVAICTLGVGQPSKVSREVFIEVDKTAVAAFAEACKAAGIRHFELLSSVGTDADSFNFYLRTKGELNAILESLQFDRLSIFQPSMILTPTNRYGFSQAVMLKVWPLLDPVLRGSWKKYRGIRVSELGRAMALNIFRENSGREYLSWAEFKAIAGSGK
ncbi:hypothetical protein CRP01_31470 [Flavilitoribacter nigricans DSM 23189 = NBRC 102662]|uniref:NAD(P)-binding domain-containing protein n=2 Tax=Flavilitoribacter TaxID=2762562 RepID=A0A2D0N277_FLAN2|nr:hypothetical protein CRP01_31470 [Flavilitoribacter nigricans DSM 23189 = NBRC 102662]